MILILKKQFQQDKKNQANQNSHLEIAQQIVTKEIGSVL
jgi:hypothetical protein